MTYAASFLDASRGYCSRHLTLLGAIALSIGLLIPTHRAHAQSATIEGTLEVQVEDDFKGNKSKTRHFLSTDAGEHYELHFKAKEPEHPSGTKVKVTGTRNGNLVTLDSGGTGSVQVITAASAPNTFGAQNTLVLLVNFADQPTNKPWTIDQVRNLVFGTVSNFYKENSFQNTWLTGDVYGWYTIPVSATCNTLDIETSAKQAATAAGVNLSAYSRYIYMFPTSSACAFSGTATVGGNPARAWINGHLDLKTIGHELGHTFGLQHSPSLACNGATLGTNCTGVEYGDGADIMGWSSSGHFNAFQKEKLGWLNYGVMPPITTVDTSGTYTIAPYETTGSSAKALKILKSIDPVTGAKTWYYVEYRQATGFDNPGGSGNSMLDSANIQNGVVIHSVSYASFLLDMTPETYDLYTRDPALIVGKSYADPDAGVTINTLWVNGTNAGVSVTLAGSASTCTRANPSILLSPSSSTSVAAGTSVSYTVAVTNNDSSGCSASTFSLQGTVPSGWSGAWAASSLTVGAGSTASTNFTVTSSTSAPAGTYSISGKANNSGATTYSGSGSASYVIATSTTTTTTKGKGRSR